MTSKPSIEGVYDHYGLRIVGADASLWRKAQCPLPDHEDDNPSATVNTDENVFWCHACARGGDSYQIVKERESLARWADVKRVTEEFAGSIGTPLPREPAGSSLLSGRPRSNSGGGTFVPPWRRI